MRQVWPRIRATWRVLWRSDRLDAAMQEEMRFHVEMEAERLVREHGVDPQDAYRQAHIRFGGLEKYKEEGRDARGRQWLDAMALDARLGVRMLIKHRGLTLAGGFAMAVAIAVGATSFEVITEMLDPALPLEDGARVVSIQQATDVPGRPERRVLPDLVAWREQLATVQQLGAFRTVQQNLVSGTRPQSRSKLRRSQPRDSPWHARPRCSAGTSCLATSGKARRRSSCSGMRRGNRASVVTRRLWRERSISEELRTQWSASCRRVSSFL